MPLSPLLTRISDLAIADLPLLAAQAWNACAGDASTAYAAARAALYREWFARQVQAQTHLSPAECRALAAEWMPAPAHSEVVIDQTLAHSLAAFGSDPRHLGELHQHLLAHELVGQPPALYLTSTAGDRRVRGSYYTPEALVRWIVRHTVGPALDGWFAHLRQRWRDDAHFCPDELFEFAVLDPAAGSGYFLLEALDLISSRMLCFLRDFPDHALCNNTESIRREVLMRCLYGIDLDPQAVGLARMALWLTAGSQSEDRALSAALSNHITQGNALLGAADTLRPNGGFDAVIGNPPYVPWHAIGPYRAAFESGNFRECVFRARPNHADAQPNLYLFFIVLMLDMLCPGGHGGFVLPPEWLTDHRANAFTVHLAQQIARGAVLMFDPELHLFGENSRPVGTASLLLGVRKRESGEPVAPSLDAFTLAGTDRATALNALEALNLWQLERAPVQGTYRTVSLGRTQHEYSQAARIAPGALLPPWIAEPQVPLITTGDRAWFEIGGGFQPPMPLVPCYTLDGTTQLHLPSNEQPLVFPALVHARSITRYQVRGEDRYWIVLNTFATANEAARAAPTLWAWLSQHRPTLEAALGADWWRFPNPRNLATLASHAPRLLTPRTAARNSFALDDTGYLFKGTNAYLRVLPPYDPAYILALLNSRLLDHYYRQAGQSYHGNARKYEPGKITHFPIRQIKFATPAAERAQMVSIALDEIERTGWIDPNLPQIAETHLAAGQADIVHDIIAALARVMSAKCTENASHPTQLRAQQIDALDRVLDSLVYSLYGLTSDQIARVEASGK